MYMYMYMHMYKWASPPKANGISSEISFLQFWAMDQSQMDCE